jgi:RNA polymerase sigma-70 factor (ECF subfamily)
VREELIAAIPRLRAFAVLICGNAQIADNALRCALTETIASPVALPDGAELLVRLFRTLRGSIRIELSGKRRRFPQGPEQTMRAHFRGAFAKLPIDRQEAILLVDAQRFSYADASRVMGCKRGTVKSRVNRARIQLALAL